MHPARIKYNNLKFRFFMYFRTKKMIFDTYVRNKKEQKYLKILHERVKNELLDARWTGEVFVYSKCWKLGQSVYLSGRNLVLSEHEIFDCVSGKFYPIKHFKELQKEIKFILEYARSYSDHLQDIKNGIKFTC